MDAANTKRLPILVLMDKSGSMEGRPIKDVKKALLSFLRKCARDVRVSSRTDLCIMAFDDTPEVIMDWAVLSGCGRAALDIDVGGTTNLDDAIMSALDMVDSKVEYYRASYTPYGAPLLVVLTDGLPTQAIDRSVEAVRGRIGSSDRSDNPRFVFLPVLIEGNMAPAEAVCARETLLRYTGSLVTGESDYGRVFDLVFDTIKTIHDTDFQKTSVSPSDYSMTPINVG